MLVSVVSLLFLGACPAIPTDDGSDTGKDSGDAVIDVDEDGYALADDCDDSDASVNPGLATDNCDEIDNDCDGETDEDPDVVWYPDGDGDGYGAAGEGVTACLAPAGHGAGDSDCDDADPGTWPSADERCDELDNDCDGLVDEELPLEAPFWLDVDGDGAGDAGTIDYNCGLPLKSGTAANGFDCDDRDSDNPAWVDVAAGSGAGTAADPFGAIVDGLRSGRTCVIVAAGEYVEDLEWPRGDVWVRGVAGASATTIRGSGTAPVVTVASGSSSLSTLDGFTITGGGGRKIESSSVVIGVTTWYTRYYGGGVAVGGGSAITLRDVVVQDNVLPEYAETSSDAGNYVTQSYGGGVYVQGGSLTLDGGAVRGNYAYNGGGVYVTGGGSFSSQRFLLAENSAYGWAALYGDQGSKITLATTIVNANAPATSPGGLSVYESTLVLTHVNVLAHDYGIYSRGSTIDAYASIFDGNAYGVQASTTTFSGTYNAMDSDRVDYTGVTDPTGTEGNLRGSCLFASFVDDADADNDDLGLGTGSPCIDAADPSEADGDGSIADIGAYGGAGAAR